MTLTNIYPITNLKELECNYKLYRVIGLSTFSRDFQKNQQKLISDLSHRTRSPCALHKSDNEIYVAQQEGYDELPTEISLVGTQVRLEDTGEMYRLDFGNLSDKNIRLATKFLQFAITNPLFNHPSLWQPSSGKPFFHKVPDKEFGNQSEESNLYKGFKFRFMVLSNNRIGLVIDTRSKYLSRNYLPNRIDESRFHNLLHRKAVYEFGNNWYEISIAGTEGLPIGEVKIKDGSSLYEYVENKIKSSNSSNLLTRLKKDGSVLVYYTSMGEPMRVPSSLCRLTHDSNHPSIRRFHQNTMHSPSQKQREIDFLVDEYFSNLKFGSSDIILGSAIRTETKRYRIPDLRFGNDKILTTNNTANSIYCHPNEFGMMKSKLLLSHDAGFYTRKEFLDQQFFVIPKSIANTFGNSLLKDLQTQFAELYGNSTKITYDPQVIAYDDSGVPSIPSLGNQIMKSIRDSIFYGGNALVMIPSISKSNKKEDKLANLVMRESRKLGLHASIMHTEVCSRSYQKVVAEDGRPYWRGTSEPRYRNKLRSYLSNVVLNKILLPNYCWPFVLDQGLESDLVIGIDIKNHTVGFTFVYGDATAPRFFHNTSRESEQLSAEHLRSQLYKAISNEQNMLSKNLKRITIHRDGILFPGEKEGILEAMKMLADEGKIAPDYDCNIVEIKKTLGIPIRLLDNIHDEGSQQELISNPTIGTYEIFGDDCYLATTGIPYKYDGTALPIHVRKIIGNMSVEKIAKDVFDLTNLTYSKIDFCSRLPFSIKMTDVMLREEAGDYEQDRFMFQKVEANPNE